VAKALLDVVGEVGAEDLQQDFFVLVALLLAAGLLGEGGFNDGVDFAG